MRLTARMRLTLLYAGLIAVTGSAVAALIIILTFPPLEDPPAGGIDVKSGEVAAKKAATVDRATLEQGMAGKLAARAELRRRMITGSAIAVGTLTVLSAGLGYWVAGRVLRPVHLVSNTARRLSEHDLHERIPVSGPRDEMRELAETFNGMLARLQRSFDAQGHFAANASHELRAPMTTQRTLVEVAAQTPGASADLRELADALRPVLGRQERLVDGLLALAWSEHGTTTIEPVRVDGLVRTALDRVRDPGLEVHRELAELTVPGDRILLDLLVDNLIRNAAKHNVDGGQVWITTRGSTLTVANTGEPLTAERLAELRQPFRRGVRDRVGAGGVGLGLAIASTVAQAHRAELRLRPRPGGGLVAEVAF